MRRAWRRIAAAATTAAFLCIFISASAQADSDVAAQDQYASAADGSQPTTTTDQNVAAPDATPQETATVIQYYPAFGNEAPVRHVAVPSPATPAIAAPGPDAAPVAAPAGATTASSRIFMLLGSGAAVASILASGMAIIRGRK